MKLIIYLFLLILSFIFDRINGIDNKSIKNGSDSLSPNLAYNYNDEDDYYDEDDEDDETSDEQNGLSIAKFLRLENSSSEISSENKEHNLLDTDTENEKKNICIEYLRYDNIF